MSVNTILQIVLIVILVILNILLKTIRDKTIKENERLMKDLETKSKEIQKNLEEHLERMKKILNNYKIK
jgi:hypothetical protein